MLNDAKTLPPPYSAARTDHATLSTLPGHVLLRIVYLTFARSDQQRTLYWLVHSLRRVDRTLYTAAMHVLRSVHLAPYTAQVRQPYSSDPFPASHDVPRRETAVLDRFIVLKVREDLWAGDSELHLERDEAYRDIFDHAQPRARLEDLVRDYATLPLPQAPSTRPATPPATPAPHKPSLLSLFRRSKPPPAPAPPVPTPAPAPLPIADLSVTLTPRSASLVSSRRTIASTPRTTDEPLEHVARRLLSNTQCT
ncbi:hypothetical protein C0992_005834 [Termitomyces sp. T32_za158]|nr:hypothetical protein C0992_005834 [Termitomyces sp. T32_za158]